MADTPEPQAALTTSTPTDKDASKSETTIGTLEPDVLLFLFSFHPPVSVCVLLNATGNVPIIKKRTWTVDPNKTVSWIQKFIHKYLKLDANEQIFLYVNQTFAPAPDQIIKNLYECHGTNGKLVLYYCKNQAWG
ncbi:hypothetical protein KR067_011795 [Drosophila pandora]|nr:hypothetical protein KR067_009690 [Drosophila pandora]KAH8351728.1 hypothetical protein KR067_011795 [Drosophila pandora]